MPPLAAPLQRKRSILNNRALIRAIDALKANPSAQLGKATVDRLRNSNPGGFDPMGTIQGLAKTGADNPELARIRQQALTGWNIQGQGEEGGNRAPLPAAPGATPGATTTPAPAPGDRRSQLLARTGANAISDDLRERILNRINREKARRR
jgi:hypothetical protein